MSFRKIIHIDMDAFYASVEQRDHLAYRGVPIVVGGLPHQRGVVATASYEARAFGIRSAMPSKKAKELCPHVIFVPPRFDVYKNVSNAIRSIFHRYTDLIEPLSLDEAYLDVTEDKQEIGSAITIAEEIKQAIKDELLLTASAGISTNKFVAKIASDLNKPDGLTFVGPSKIESFIAQLPIEKFYGIGSVTAKKMKSLNIYSGAELREASLATLIRHFGKVGKFYYDIARGIDNRPVQSARAIKSISVEDTFRKDLFDLDLLREELSILVDKLAVRLESKQLTGHTITLKIKFADFKQITRNYTHPTPIPLNKMKHHAFDLLDIAPIEGRGVRLLGIGISNLPDQLSSQLTLF